MIIFVGDKPSSKNIDPNIPFVGTPSYKNLLMWIYELDIDISQVFLYNQIEHIPVVMGVTYIALGNNAAKRLDELSVSYFKLPHPSPKNRTLNNKKWIKQQLELCCQFIKDSR